MKNMNFLILSIGIFIFYSSASVAAEKICEFEVIKNQRYGYGKTENGEKPLYLDAYIPTECNGKKLKQNLPPIGVVHGGAFIIGSKETMAGISGRLAKAGFAAFAINYRLKGDEPVSETFSQQSIIESYTKLVNSSIEDVPSPRDAYLGSIAVEDAIKAKNWVNKNSKKFNIDKKDWGLIGSSAGAATVMSMAYTADNVLEAPQKNLDAVVSLWGDFSPVGAMESGESDLLIVHGTEDTTIPFEDTDKILKRADEVGVKAKIIPLDGAGHSAFEELYTDYVPGTNILVWDAVITFFDNNLR